ncbi:hypothetical protein H8356DRAFT_1303721 [Neocallimastix lanati (nom. inval.)]|nr:hypothetical protein H8356DRAFT_1303721 [Neocallimastix sp. JGI-2020a]
MSIPLPVAGGKISFSDWPKNNSENDHRISNKEKVFNKINHKYHPYKKTIENLEKDFQMESEENKDNEYVSSFLSKLPIHKSYSPKKKNSTPMNGMSSYEGNNYYYYNGLTQKLLEDGPPHLTLDELSSSPEKQPFFSQNLKTMHFLLHSNNLESISNINSNLSNKMNIFGNKISQLNPNNININTNNNNNNNSTTNNINRKTSLLKDNILNTFTSTGINKNLNSIIVYGYPVNLANEIILHFKSFGEISTLDSMQENNWALITYRSSLSAKKALKYKNAFMFKNNIIGMSFTMNTSKNNDFSSNISKSMNKKSNIIKSFSIKGNSGDTNKLLKRNKVQFSTIISSKNRSSQHSDILDPSKNLSSINFVNENPQINNNDSTLDTYRKVSLLNNLTPTGMKFNPNSVLKEDKEEKSIFARKSNIFHHSHYSPPNTMNSSITIPKIGNNKIVKPNTSSNVKDTNSSLLGKMVELVFGW